MTGLDYTERLIIDIDKLIELEKDISNLFSEDEKIKFLEEPNFSNVLISSDVLVAKNNLDIISQFVNYNERLVDHDKGNQVTLSLWKRDLTEKKEKVAKIFQHILDNNQVVDLLSNQPLSVYLINFLELLHNPKN